jgi:hypothetical protein
MMMIGVDYHPSFQEIAFFVEETGEYGEQRLNHDGREAEQFYRDLKQRGIHVRVGMEATGSTAMAIPICNWRATSSRVQTISRAYRGRSVAA